MDIKVALSALALWSATNALAVPVTYQLKKEHTDVTFRISHAGFTMKHGSFAEMSGTLNLELEHLGSSSVEATVSMSSISTSMTKRDHDLQDEHWLASDKYPDMHFVSTKVVQLAPEKIDIEGNLTLHGVTKPLTLHATINRIGINPFGNAQTAGFSATATLKRSEYGITTLLPMIGDEVAIEIDAEFAVLKTN